MRLKTETVKIGSKQIGGLNPVLIQSMTNTDTADAEKTSAQCIELYKAGAEIIRITVNDENAAKAVPEIRKILDRKGFKDLPLIGDFHFNGHKLLKDFELCAKTLDKYRINPGNLGYGKKHDENFETIIKIAKKYKKPVRIGVNFGSVDPELKTKMMEKNTGRKNPVDLNGVMIETVVKSALDSAVRAEELGLKRNMLVLSVKMSDVLDTIKAYELLAAKMKKAKRLYALHLGLTEAGAGLQGVVASTSALSILLHKGIGDTIRVSLTPAPAEPRTKEVEVARHILQSLNLQRFTPKIISCPGCGRTDAPYFEKMAAKIRSRIENPKFMKKYPHIKNLKIAIMGCIVNGPGESRSADIAIHLPGKTEQKIASIYLNGKPLKTVTGPHIEKEFIKELENLLT